MPERRSADDGRGLPDGAPQVPALFPGRGTRAALALATELS